MNGTAQNDAQARLVVENASLRYGALDVLHDLSLSVGSTEIVSIVGPSGCGKTTLLRCVGGLNRLNGGEIRIDGQMVEKPLPIVSMVFQHFGLFPWKNLWSNIAYGLSSNIFRTRRSNAASAKRSNWSGSKVSRNHIRISFPAACSSAPAWRARW